MKYPISSRLPKKCGSLLHVFRCCFVLLPLVCDAKPKTSSPTQDPSWTPTVWDAYLFEGPVGDNLPDFSLAGYRQGKAEIPNPPVTLSVLDYGAVPNDGKDDTAAIQAAINAVEDQGGGVVFFPAGRYDLLMPPAEGADPLPADLQNGLVVSHSGVVLRGAGSGPDGSILHRHTVISGNGKALMRFEGPTKTQGQIKVLADARRGDRELSIDNNLNLVPGDIVRLALVDPAVVKENPQAEGAELASEFVAPFQLTDEHFEYIRRSVNSEFNYYLEVEAIPEPGRVRFKQPIRRDIPTRFQARLQALSMIQDVGIENIRFTSSWPGGYSHHKPFPHDAKGDYKTGGPGVIRTAYEQNADWKAIGFSRVAHSWVKDVSTDNFTIDVDLYECKNITVDGLKIEGQSGHVGVTLSRSHDCLVKNVVITAPRVHPFMVTFFASGNAFTSSRVEYGPFDKVSDCDTCLDFHGAAPNENLFDSIQNAYVYSGGAYAYLPHAGQRNVFWNITAPERMERGNPGNEFFRTYARTSSGEPNTAHEHFPKSFVIGLHRQGPVPVTIGGSSGDRADEWITIEGLNRPGVQPSSLYEAQRKACANPE